LNRGLFKGGVGLRLILAGFGVVGRSLAELVEERIRALKAAYGLSPRFVAIVDRGGAALAEEGLELELALKAKKLRGTVAAYPGAGRPGLSVVEALDEAEADVLVDATPTNLVDGEPSYSFTRKALALGLHVVTVNKGPLALALPALRELAAHKGVVLRFSGSVGGGMPVIEFARQCAIGDKVVKVEGILNGTTNYILTRMEEAGLSFEDALREAQEKGYAERDPTLDVKGFDTAAKLVILANEVLGIRATLEDVSIRGIDDVVAGDVENAARNGMAIRLLGKVDGGLRVEPTMIKREDPLAVKYAMNAVAFHMESSGRHVITGKGAGGRETATAIIRDLIEVKKFMMGGGV